MTGLQEAASKDHQPAVSVILPTYNRAALISRAIQSVLGQTFTDLELLVIDDGSTDDTAGVVSAFGDPRLFYHRLEHGERSAARNRGIRLSRGKWIAFLDSDDWYLPGKLAVQVADLQSHPEAGLSLGGWRIVDPGGRVIQSVHPWEQIPGEPSIEDWLAKAISTPITILVEKGWLERAGGFDAGLYMAEDVELHIRLALAGCRAVWTQKEIAVVLAHPGNSLRDWPSVRQGRLDYLEKIFSLPGLPRHLITARSQITASTHLSLAMLAYDNGLFEQAQAELCRALELYPRLSEREFGPVVERIVGHAGYFLTTDPAGFVARVLDHLPGPLGSLRGRRREILGMVWSSQAWKAHAAGDLPLMRKSVLRAVWYRPSLLANRGVLSMLGQSVAGQQVWSKLKSRTSS